MTWRVLPIFLLLLSSCSVRTYDQPIRSSALLKDRSHLIVIDAGHGGKDLGTHSLEKPKYIEKELSLKTAKLLQRYLEDLGYPTFMTRTTDEFIALKKRAEIANKRRAMLFISVHYNAALNKQAKGVEVYYYEKDSNKGRVSKSKLLADLVLQEILNHTGAESRGVRHGNFAVIRETKMPAILVEGGFLTNDGERKNIYKPNYLRKIATGIAHGIERWK